MSNEGIMRFILSFSFIWVKLGNQECFFKKGRNFIQLGEKWIQL